MFIDVFDETGTLNIHDSWICWTTSLGLHNTPMLVLGKIDLHIHLALLMSYISKISQLFLNWNVEMRSQKWKFLQNTLSLPFSKTAENILRWQFSNCWYTNVANELRMLLLFFSDYLIQSGILQFCSNLGKVHICPTNPSLLVAKNKKMECERKLFGIRKVSIILVENKSDFKLCSQKKVNNKIITTVWVHLKHSCTNTLKIHEPTSEFNMGQWVERQFRAKFLPDRVNCFITVVDGTLFYQVPIAKSRLQARD